MKEAKVKGTVLLDYVRLIRVNKNKNWDKYLKKEDWSIINGRILPSVWYSCELFFRFGEAVLSEIAKGDLNTVKQFGKSNAETLFKGTYKGIMDSTASGGSEVIKSLERYVTLSPSLFNFITVHLEKISEKRVKLHVKIDLQVERKLLEPYFTQLSGTMERLTEMSGGKNVKVTTSERHWEGASDTILDIVWE